jgi:hypothetical protein
MGAGVTKSVKCVNTEWMTGRPGFGTIFYDAFSVTRLHSVDDRVTSD